MRPPEDEGRPIRGLLLSLPVSMLCWALAMWLFWTWFW